MAKKQVTFEEVLTFERASTATYFDSNGVLQTAAIDEPRFNYNKSTGEPEGLLIETIGATNLFLNSDTPTTQTVTINSGEDYTVSCYGQGSVTLSDAASGVVEEGSEITFVATTSSLTCTVNNVDYVQVESGQEKTSVILTENSPATRSPETIITKGGI